MTEAARWVQGFWFVKAHCRETGGVDEQIQQAAIYANAYRGRCMRFERLARGFPLRQESGRKRAKSRLRGFAPHHFAARSQPVWFLSRAPGPRDLRRHIRSGLE